MPFSCFSSSSSPASSSSFPPSPPGAGSDKSEDTAPPPPGRFLPLPSRPPTCRLRASRPPTPRHPVAGSFVSQNALNHSCTPRRPHVLQQRARAARVRERDGPPAVGQHAQPRTARGVSICSAQPRRRLRLRSEVPHGRAADARARARGGTRGRTPRERRAGEDEHAHDEGIDLVVVVDVRTPTKRGVNHRLRLRPPFGASASSSAAPGTSTAAVLAADVGSTPASFLAAAGPDGVLVALGRTGPASRTLAVLAAGAAAEAAPGPRARRADGGLAISSLPSRQPAARLAASRAALTSSISSSRAARPRDRTASRFAGKRRVRRVHRGIDRDAIEPRQRQRRDGRVRHPALRARADAPAVPTSSLAHSSRRSFSPCVVVVVVVFVFVFPPASAACGPSSSSFPRAQGSSHRVDGGLQQTRDSSPRRARARRRRWRLRCIGAPSPTVDALRTRRRRPTRSPARAPSSSSASASAAPRPSSSSYPCLAGARVAKVLARPEESRAGVSAAIAGRWRGRRRRRRRRAGAVFALLSTGATRRFDATGVFLLPVLRGCGIGIVLLVLLALLFLLLVVVVVAAAAAAAADDRPSCTSPSSSALGS